MTESSSSTHDTPASLKEALHLAIDSLPTQSSSFGQISAGLVLEAINRLQFKGFSQDDQLAAILWTLPRKEALCLAPNYLIADIDAVSNLWKVFLIHLSYQTSSDQLSATTIGTAISKAPARVRSILSVFLTVANEHCCRSMSTDIPNTVSKPYLQNLLVIARALEKHAVDTTADDLVASVENAIDKAHLGLANQSSYESFCQGRTTACRTASPHPSLHVADHRQLSRQPWWPYAILCPYRTKPKRRQRFR